MSPATGPPAAERALAITEAAPGPDQPSTALSLANLVRTYSDLDGRADALRLRERAQAITAATTADGHHGQGPMTSNQAMSKPAISVERPAHASRTDGMDVSDLFELAF